MDQCGRKDGISALTRTTRDEPDYDRLMSYRLGILDQNDIKMGDITSTIESMDPMEGATEFLASLSLGGPLLSCLIPSPSSRSR